MRLEGDPAEARAFLAALTSAGAEVQLGTTKNRGDYSHVYAVIRMPGYHPAPAGDTNPVRAEATVRQPAVDRERRALRGRRR